MNATVLNIDEARLSHYIINTMVASRLLEWNTESHYWSNKNFADRDNNQVLVCFLFEFRNCAVQAC